MPRSARILFFNSLILPIFDYADIVWGDKDNALLMNNLQLLHSKAARTIVDRPFHSSATDALEALAGQHNLCHESMRDKNTDPQLMDYSIDCYWTYSHMD